MERCVLGIDGGGTKTVCVLADSDGKVIGHGSGGTTNPNLVSAPEIKETLQKAILEAVPDHPELQIEASGLCRYRWSWRIGTKTDRGE